MEKDQYVPGVKVLGWTSSERPGDCSVSRLGGIILGDYEEANDNYSATVMVRWDNGELFGIPDQRMPISVLTMNEI